MVIRPKSFEEFHGDFKRVLDALPEDMTEGFNMPENILRRAHRNKDEDAMGKARYKIFLEMLRALRRIDHATSNGESLTLERLEAKVSKRFGSRRLSQNIAKDLDSRRIAGKPLWKTQKMAAIGFSHWLNERVMDKRLMGHLVVPTGVGKTYTSILFSEMVTGRTVVFALNNSDGSKIVKDFRAHQATLPPLRQRTVGQSFDQREDTDTDIVVAGFQSKEKFWRKIDWNSVGLIVCDEADVNALSPKRRERLITLAEEYGIPVVGMSATEEQASGKVLQHVFPDEILRLPLPDSLPQCLKMGLVPQQRFYDVYFDLELKLNPKRLKQNKDATDDEIEHFIASSAWNTMLLDHYLAHHASQGRPEPALAIFRNNTLVENFVEQAREKGVRAAAYTQLTPTDKREELRQQLAKGTLDILAGSRLLGRGLDIPEVNLVYNSTITFSPQIFWQADGRGSRINPNDQDKVTQIYAVLPRFIRNMDTLEDLSPHERPLCHEAFFNPDYFKGEGRLIDLNRPRKNYPSGYGRSKSAPTPIHHFDLSDYDTIRSVKEVANVMRRLWEKPEDFTSRSSILALFLDSAQTLDLNRGLVKMITRMRNVRLQNLAEKMEGQFETPDEDREPLPTTVESLFGIELTLREEKQLIEDYQKGLYSHDPAETERGDRAKVLLIRGHLPLVISSAKKFIGQGVDLDDLIQEGLVTLNEILEHYDTTREARFASFAVWSLMGRLQGLVFDSSRNVRLPSNAYVVINHALKEAEKRGPDASVDYEATATKFETHPDTVRHLVESYLRDEFPIHEDARIESPAQSLTSDDSEILDYPDILGPDSVAASEALDPDRINDPETATLFFDLRGQIQKALSTLSPREEAIIRDRFGLLRKSKPDHYDNDRTLKEIGDDFGSFRESIRQTEARALRKLRHPSRSKRLAAYFDEIPDPHAATEKYESRLVGADRFVDKLSWMIDRADGVRTLSDDFIDCAKNNKSYFSEDHLYDYYSFLAFYFGFNESEILKFKSRILSQARFEDRKSFQEYLIASCSHPRKQKLFDDNELDLMKNHSSAIVIHHFGGLAVNNLPPEQLLRMDHIIKQLLLMRQEELFARASKQISEIIFSVFSSEEQKLIRSGFKPEQGQMPEFVAKLGYSFSFYKTARELMTAHPNDWEVLPITLDEFVLRARYGIQKPLEPQSAFGTFHSFPEIAKMRRLSSGQVKNIHDQALKKMQGRLRKKEYVLGLMALEGATNELTLQQQLVLKALYKGEGLELGIGSVRQRLAHQLGLSMYEVSQMESKAVAKLVQFHDALLAAQKAKRVA